MGSLAGSFVISRAAVGALGWRGSCRDKPVRSLFLYPPSGAAAALALPLVAGVSVGPGVGGSGQSRPVLSLTDEAVRNGDRGLSCSSLGGSNDGASFDFPNLFEKEPKVEVLWSLPIRSGDFLSGDSEIRSALVGTWLCRRLLSTVPSLFKPRGLSDLLGKSETERC